MATAMAIIGNTNKAEPLRTLRRKGFALVMRAVSPDAGSHTRHTVIVVGITISCEKVKCLRHLEGQDSSQIRTRLAI